MPTDITTQTRLMSGNPAGTVQKNVVIEPNKAVTRQTVSAREQDLPPARESSLPPAENELENVTSDMNKYVQTMQRDLHFSVDEESGETVIKVVESESQRLVRTIPSEEFLHASKEFNGSVGMLLKAKA